MKKIFLLGILVLFIATGCGKFDANKALAEFKDNVSSAKAYEIKGKMEIRTDEDVFTYTINVGFKKDDLYRVSLINQTNNHEQVILKTDDSVYVITPSLNKSFKFQSDWPKNSSQGYLLASILNDLEKMEKLEMEETDDYYILKANVNYPNNPDLANQKVYFDKEMNLKKVEVFNDDNQVRIAITFESINYKAKFASDYFALESIIDEDCCNGSTDGTSSENSTENNPENETNPEGDTNVNGINEILYPLYVPTNTYLQSKDTVNTSSGERVILTFAGEKNFIIVQETLNIPSELEVIPVYGDPLLFNDTIAALSGNSLYWSSNKVDYYLTSDNLTGAELMTIAASLSNTVSVGK